MAPPSALAIATQSVQRLVKEESYYHKDQTNQEARIKKLQDDIEAGGPDLDANAEFMLKQEVRHRPLSSPSDGISSLILATESRPGGDQEDLWPATGAHRHGGAEAGGADCHIRERRHRA